MKTRKLIALFLIGTGVSLQSLAQYDEPYGLEKFPTENGKYREIASRSKNYNTTASPPTLNLSDSTLTTYKNDSTNAIDVDIKYGLNITDNTWYPQEKDEHSYDTTATMITITIVHSVDWSSGGVDGLKINDRNIIELDRANRRSLAEQSDIWDEATNAYKPVMRYQYSYDATGRRIEAKLFNWFSTEWRASNRVQFEYDGSSNRITKMTFSQFDPMPPHNEFMIYKVEYAYNSDNQIINEESYQYLSFDNSWDLDEKIRYVYNGTLLDSVVTEKSYTDGEGNKKFALDEEIILTYNSDQRLIEELHRQTQGALGSPLIDNMKYIHTYDAGGVIKNTLVKQFFTTPEPGEWRDNERVEYTYNDGGYITKYKKEYWNTTNSEWLLKIEEDYYYQENQEGYKDVYYFLDADPVNGGEVSINDLETIDIEMYPNPTQNELNVRYNSPEDATYSIVSIQGQFATRGKLQQGVDNKISLSNVPSGHYILLIHGSTVKASRSFVKN